MFGRLQRWACVAAGVGVTGGLLLWLGPAAVRRQSVRSAWHDYGTLIEWTVRRQGAGGHGLVRSYEVTTWRTWGAAGRLDDVRAMHARSAVPPPQSDDPDADDRRPQHLVWDGVRWPDGGLAVRVQGSTWTLPYSLVVLGCGGVLLVGGVRVVRRSKPP